VTQTGPTLLARMARLNRRLVLCVSQAECDVMEAELQVLEKEAASTKANQGETP
jgi:hypothetical protein